MAFANNRSAARPSSTFSTAGGVIMRLRHPYLSGQVSGASPIDEVDVSRCVKLNDTFLSALPAMDSAFQEVLVDGSVLTVTNHIMAGKMTIPVVRTTGLVGTGDFIACAHLIIASKDSQGSTFTVIEYINGNKLCTVFYGVSFANVPHLIKAGNAIVTYPVVMNYAGWFQCVGAESTSEQTIWAVGNKLGIKAEYRPYAVQSGESTTDFYGGSPATSVVGVDTDAQDSADGDITTEAVVPTAADGIASGSTPTQVTWS
jgi:hypothetical protein